MEFVRAPTKLLEKIVAGTCFLWIALGGLPCIIFTIYLILYTRFWIEAVAYLVWIFLWDNDAKITGNRRSQWFRDLSVWKYLTQYFPVGVEKLPWVELDPKKNYLFCVFPHGMISFGAICGFGTSYGMFKSFFPDHDSLLVTLSQHFSVPFFREMILGFGGISCEAKAIETALIHPGGGQVCVLMPGGARESYYCKPGQYKILLNERKGFVKLALRTGAPLVPVISFGETDLFDQYENPTLRQVQEIIRNWTGVALAVPIGRGFLGLVPRRKPIRAVVGNPMEIPKIEFPTSKDVEEYHAKFGKAMQEMFEEQKYNYLSVDEAEKTHLVLV
ncbi:unnamed protein product [Ceutorhynchus assimilis]|uniref:Acyltransferase n=1 Tax=Ceutorhynchus assimilis TaxID=467358 RepID=A0A9N9QJ90_9CUCU|nr:unnamed protein product [Ceutorhynchus assimilis]